MFGLLRRLRKILGFRWSLYFVRGAKTDLRYVMHHDCIITMIGFVMHRFLQDGDPSPPWKIYANFNRTHDHFELKKEHFTRTGSDLTKELIQTIKAIDPGFMVASTGEPLFIDVVNNRRIPVMSEASKARLSGDSSAHYEAVRARLEDIAAGKRKEKHFFDIMREIFPSSQK